MKKQKICFLVGSMAISGGTYVIVQHAAYLSEQGYAVTLAVQEPFNEETLSWHDQISRLTCLPFHVATNEIFDLVIATWWKTALELINFKAPRYAYFVQSIESRFYPEEEKPLRSLVEETYNFNIPIITEAKWIKKYLIDRYQKKPFLVPNGVRKDIYGLNENCIEPRDLNRPRVLIEGPFGVPFKNTALAIRLAKKAGAKEIWVLTSSPVKSLPGVTRVFSRIPMFKTAEIYRSCDVLVKLSTVEGMFGPPLEMFHCGGTSVVFDVTGHDEYIVNGENSIVVTTGDLNSVINSISNLLTNQSERIKLIHGAKKTAEKWPNWNESSAMFRDWVDEVLNSSESNRAFLHEKTDKALMQYKVDENKRLNSKPWLVRRHKLRRLLSMILPQWIVKKFKMFESWYEVLFGKNVVY
jgi:glycosyltransferase involved in cell wall biosynthesis